MNSRFRTGLIIAIVGFVLISLGVFLSIRLLNLDLVSWTQPQVPPTPVAEEKSMIAVAASDVKAGMVLSADNVKLSEIPLQFATRDTIQDLKLAIGKISKIDLYQGEIVLQHNLADPTGVASDVAYVLDDKHVLMAVPSGDLMSRLAIIRRGDIVDILVSYPEQLIPAVEGGPELPPQLVVFTPLQKLDITAMVIQVIQDPNADPNAPIVDGDNASRDQIVVQAYLLALNPQDALVLKYLKDIGGNFDFVIRAPTSSGQFELTPVTSQYIKELYGLQLLP